jgi:hypothetical protein
MFKKLISNTDIMLHRNIRCFLVLCPLVEQSLNLIIKYVSLMHFHRTVVTDCVLSPRKFGHEAENLEMLKVTTTYNKSCSSD